MRKDFRIIILLFYCVCIFPRFPIDGLKALAGFFSFVSNFYFSKT